MAKKRNEVQVPENVLEVCNGGPIAGTFRVELNGPGLYCLQGGKGTGKSTVMRGLQLLQGHSVDITVHDGELNGHVAGFGVVAPLGSRKRAKGDFTLQTLGDCEQRTFADFVNPPGKTPAVRDRECIKALASLSGMKADPAAYYDLVGGKAAFDALEVQLSDDPVVLASRVKSAIESKARELESSADREEGHAVGLEEKAVGLHLTEESNVEQALETLGVARRNWCLLVERQDAACVRNKEIEEARQRIEAAKKDYTGPTVVEAGDKLTAATRILNTQEKVLKQREEELLRARADLEKERAEYDKAVADLDSAKRYADTIAAWEQTIAQPVDCPTEDEILAARAAGEKARHDYDLAVRVREAKQAVERAQRHREIADRDRAEADKYRKAASGTFGVLTAGLRTERIKVEQIDGDARLVVQHPKRGKTFFDRENGLSEGERIMVAIEELLPKVESPGLFDVPQEIYQGIQPADRKKLDEYAKKRGIYVFGALVTDGDLCVVRGG